MSVRRWIDHLRGLKENVTMGRLIPAGMGFEWYRYVRIPPDEPPLSQPTEEDLDREIEYAFDADKPLAGTRSPVGDVKNRENLNVRGPQRQQGTENSFLRAFFLAR